MSQYTYPTNEKPGLVKVIAVLTLINGIVNLFWGLVAAGTVTASVVLICLAPFAILPTVLGIFELIYAAKLLAEPMRPVQPSQTLAILEIVNVLTGNVFSMVVGILSLVFYNDIQVKEYFARLNGTPAPAAPAQPVQPASPADVEPAPVTESESVPETPKAPAEPEPRKTRQRKVAKDEDDAIG